MVMAMLEDGAQTIVLQKKSRTEDRKFIFRFGGEYSEESSNFLSLFGNKAKERRSLAAANVGAPSGSSGSDARAERAVTVTGERSINIPKGGVEPLPPDSPFDDEADRRATMLGGTPSRALTGHGADQSSPLYDDPDNVGAPMGVGLGGGHMGQHPGASFASSGGKSSDGAVY